MIELAPNHKYGLPIQNPVMPAAGAFGYGEEYHDLVAISQLGAIVSNPVSLRPRHAARGQRIATYHDHLVVHTGLPNPGLNRVIRAYARIWERAPVPVIVHLIATTPADVSEAVQRLSTVRGVMGIELGLDEGAQQHTALALLNAARTDGDLPVIVRVPFKRVNDLALPLAKAGADALTLSAAPRVIIPLNEPGMTSLAQETEDNIAVARYMRGRLYGPGVFPILLHTLDRWGKKLSVPIIASGGITTPAEVESCLLLGAVAVQIDGLLWRDPDMLNRLSSLQV